MKRVWNYIVINFKIVFSTTFVVSLFVAIVLWVGIKLGDTYTTKTNFAILLNDQSVQCSVTIEGSGYQIIKFKNNVRTGVVIERSEVRLRRITADSLIIEPTSLQRTLASRYYDGIKILSVLSIDNLK